MINIALITIYFCVSWLTPWDSLVLTEMISSSYLWDLLFSLTVIVIFKLRPFSLDFKFTPFVLRAVMVVLIALIALYFLDINSIETPFQYIERPWIQLLLFAPIFEELVFRGSLQEKLKKDMQSKTLIPLISAILFSASHAIALWFLHDKFHTFVYVQLGYTFFLGWILAKAQDRGAKTIEPMLLHFIFNLFFVPW